MEDRRRGSSEGVERRLLLLDWRCGKRCLRGLEEEGALYALPVVVGGGRCGSSDLASAMVSMRVPHGRSEVVVEEEDGGVATGTKGRFYVDTLAQSGMVDWSAA